MLTAEKLGVAVQHPIIDAIRRCSPRPNLAVDFFTKILHPKPEARMTVSEAERHPWLRPKTVSIWQMFSRMLLARKARASGGASGEQMCYLSLRSHIVCIAYVCCGNSYLTLLV